MRLFEKKADGYLTLEACFLVPLTFFVFALIIHLCFYLYGRSLLTQDVYLLAFRASLLSEKEDREGFVAQNAAFQFDSRYFGNDTPQVEVRIAKDTVTVFAKSTTHRSGFDLAASDPWQPEARARAVHYDMPAHMRRVKRIAEIIRAGLVRMNGGDN